MTGLIAAIDTARLHQAQHLAAMVRPHCAMLKLGLEFFCAHGAEGVRAVGGPVFLDLKLHDIPATVGGAVEAILPLGPRFVTLHAAGGAAMIEAARRGAETAGSQRPRLLAVTVLTSLAADDLHALGIAASPREQVVRLGLLAMASGADGLVCSAHEVAKLRDALGADAILVAPGVRPAGWVADDQARIATPTQAAAWGADYVVVGRPIATAADPAAAAASIAAELVAT